jgi:metal-dependent amidase/aminoacylase/carboxypeptidase family protein
MPKSELIAALAPEITAIRRDLHAHPELQYDVHRTAGVVAEKLKAWGVDEVVTGIGQTGVVGVIKGKGQGSGKVIAMRADMDALPIHEETNLPHRSTVPGRCMPAAMTATPPCCSAPRNTSPRPAISTAPRC